MSTETLEQEVPAAQPTEQPAAQILPACPYCGDDPVKLNLMFQAFPGGQIAALVFCGNLECRKMLPAQIVAQPTPKQPTILTPRSKL